MLPPVSAEPLSIAQVTPHRRGTGPVNEYVSAVSEELERRGHEVLLVAAGDPVKKLLRSTPLDIVHVHEPFAPSVSSAALRHSFSLNVATFHAPQERVLSTQVARPLVEIFFGRLDARTVAAPATAELLERYFPGPYELVEPAAPIATGPRSPTSWRRSICASLARRHDPPATPRCAAGSPSAR